MPRNSQVHFRLKPIDGEGKSLIYLQYIYNRQRLFYSFGQRIDPAKWNFSKQRAKESRAPLKEDWSVALNKTLAGLEEICKKYAQQGEEKNPTPEILKSHLDAFLNRNQKPGNKGDLYELIDRFIAGEIKSGGRDKSKGTITNYKSVLLHLKSFEKATDYPVRFETITLDFFYRYTAYLKKQGNEQTGGGLSINTIAKDIRLLKVFMSEAMDLNLTNNMQFKHKKFSVTSEETNAVYLKEQEIIKIYNTEMPTRRLENTRDLFVFGCFVGLRFSDFTNIKPENIIKIEGEHFIKMITAKTGELVIIPCNPIVLEIFEKYKSNPNHLPHSVSNQKFNQFSREVLQIAGLHETGRLESDLERPLYECVSSHTARRSFATNLYIDGVPVIDIMRITGHKTEKAFMKYIKISKEDTAKRISKHSKENWSKKMLKLAI